MKACFTYKNKKNQKDKKKKKNILSETSIEPRTSDKVTRRITYCATKASTEWDCKFIVFKSFANEILPVHPIWSQQSFIYQELKVVFEKNKHVFDSKSRTLTHSVAFEEHMADKCLVQLAILGVYLKRITYNSATVNISEINNH